MHFQDPSLWVRVIVFWRWSSLFHDYRGKLDDKARQTLYFDSHSYVKLIPIQSTHMFSFLTMAGLVHSNIFYCNHLFLLLQLNQHRKCRKQSGVGEKKNNTWLGKGGHRNREVCLQKSELCQNEGNRKNYKLKQAKCKIRIWHVNEMSKEKLAKDIRIYNTSFSTISRTGRAQEKL